MFSQYTRRRQSVSSPPDAFPSTAAGETTSKSAFRHRSSSITGAVKKLFPTHRTERGGTLRHYGYHEPGSVDGPASTAPASRPGTSISHGRQDSDKFVRWNTAIDLPSESRTPKSPPGAHSQRLYQERREKRRIRRSLKQSGDYLGVQGVNPSTGELDVSSPSSSSASQFTSIHKTIEEKKAAYEKARRQLELQRLKKWEKDKESIKAHQRSVKWQKHGQQWSSAKEPNLSPIAGSSQGSTPRRSSPSSGTVVRTRTNSTTHEQPPSAHGSNQIERWPSYSDLIAVESEEQDRASTQQASTQGRPVATETTSQLPIPCKPLPLPSPSNSHCLPQKRSYSDLIPVDTETFDEPPPVPPKVGPKPNGYKPGQSVSASSRKENKSRGLSSTGPASRESRRAASGSLPVSSYLGPTELNVNSLNRHNSLGPTVGMGTDSH